MSQCFWQVCDGNEALLLGAAWTSMDVHTEEERVVRRAV